MNIRSYDTHYYYIYYLLFYSISYVIFMLFLFFNLCKVFVKTYDCILENCFPVTRDLTGKLGKVGVIFSEEF